MNIASGSSGNATYIGNEHTHLLVDSGISRKRIEEGLRKLDLTLKDLDAILVTHEHRDHTMSLGVMERSLELPVYATDGTSQAIIESGCLNGQNDVFQTIYAGQTFTVGDIHVLPIKVSHDAREPVCFRIEDHDSSCAVVTDLGVYDQTLVDALQGLQALLIEANHDRRMLETGPYPYPLKRRIAGEKGHLSNEHSGRLLCELLHERLEVAILGHLSEKNNYAQLARLTVETEIDGFREGFHAKDFRIDVADPKLGTAIYTF